MKTTHDFLSAIQNIDGKVNSSKTLVTNFPLDKEPLYRDALEKLNMPNKVWIEDDAYWADGTLDRNLKSLHTSSRECAGVFWKIFYQLSAS